MMMKTPVGCSATPQVINEWFASFGLGDNKLCDAEADEETDQADTSDETFYGQYYFENPYEQEDGGNLEKRSNTNTPCDPTKCRMLHGICCDCCKCLHHCQCGDLKLLPPTCDTPDCSERVCPQCMRCSSHCLCRCSTVRSEVDGYYLASFSPTASVASGKSNSQSLKTASISQGDRIAPPPQSYDMESSTPEHFARDRSSLVTYDDDVTDDVTDDWMGHNTRVMTSNGTVATLTSTTDETVRRGKTNFEVIYDKNYTSLNNRGSPKMSNNKTNCEVVDDKNYTSSNSPRNSTKMNNHHRASFVAYDYQDRQANENQRNGRTLGGTKNRPLSKSWHVRSRPRGSAAMAEF